MNDRERRIRQRLKDDLPHYCEKCLKVRAKSGAIVPLKLNKAQTYLHNILEEQKRKTGKVRALVLKGRQMGISTYIEARFYHKTTWNRGQRTFILTHEDEATKNIFDMADRFHKHCPSDVKAHTGKSNEKELLFDVLDSGYRVATARTKGAGRSGTWQFFHGSEVAFWPNAESHFRGAMQAVPGDPGTEVLLESTSDGASGVFYNKCIESESDDAEYMIVFLPWFWQEEYRAPSDGIEFTADEEAYRDEYGLDDEQMAWRRHKIRELEGVWNFQREYPATVEEAFSAERPGALWSRDLIEQNRIRVQDLPEMRRIVVGVDPPGKEETECGIVVGGVGVDGVGYVLSDVSGHLSPNGWGRRTVNAYHSNEADRVIAEINYGGDMVKHTITQIDDTVSYKGVHASKSKQARAEPIASLTEDGRVKFAGTLPRLENELVTWEPGKGKPSPNRLDAFAWAMRELMLGRHAPSVSTFGPTKTEAATVQRTPSIEFGTTK